jgi:aldose 1-epimerase
MRMLAALLLALTQASSYAHAGAPAHASAGEHETGSARARTGISVQDWGATRDGRHVERVTVQNARGMRLSYIDYGATLIEVAPPGRHGAPINVILSLPSLAAYEANGRRYGAIMGRYAGRIGGARFTLDGDTIKLVPNAKGTALHGDPDGYDKRVWKRRDFADAASLGSVFTLVSAAGDQQMPGTVTVQVTYRLLRYRNEFHIEYAADTDSPTVINLTNHGFYNLAGAAAGAAGLATHRFMIAADRYAVTDAKRVPTGELASVTGTALDPPNFDHSLLFASRASAQASAHVSAPASAHAPTSARASASTPALATVAVISESTSGRRLTVRTTEPSVQFNTGSGFDGSEVGSEGVAYQRYAGFAFETQHLPDSPNHPAFPPTTLRPGQPYRSVTVYRFN